MTRLKVAILAGGRSSEHEISLASARSVLESLDPAEYDVVTVAIVGIGIAHVVRRRRRDDGDALPGS